MGEGRAKTLVVASVGTATVLGSLESIARGNRPDVRLFVGAGVAGFLLLLLAELAPQLAAAFALLLLVGALLRNGSAAFSALHLS